jgi:hypothetical protein
MFDVSTLCVWEEESARSAAYFHDIFAIATAMDTSAPGEEMMIKG